MNRRDQGTLVHLDHRPALRFERRYRQPPERVWRALTEPAELRRWFPSDIEGGWEIGAELRFVDDEQRAAAREAGEPTRADGPVFRGTVVAHDPPKVLAFTWGNELLRFELHPDDGGTRLIFTQVLSHTSVAARNGAGWDACLAELDRLVEGSPAGTVGEDGAGDGGPDAGEADWMAVYEDYLRRIGPDLGVPAADGSMTWERATHVDAERVRVATSDPAERAGWGAGDRDADALRWDITEADEHGTTYRLTHRDVGDDAGKAAAWHALLVQLDMWLAAGQLVPARAELWTDAYGDLLARTGPRA